MAAGQQGDTEAAWMFQRMKGVLDIKVFWGSTANAPIKIRHDLGTTPQLTFIKNMDGSYNWLAKGDVVRRYGNSEQRDDYILINESDEAVSADDYWDGTDDASYVYLKSGTAQAGGANNKYVAVMWGSVEGISKIGRYTNDGSDLTIDCGFQPRFVMVKCLTHSSTNWHYRDSTHGWNYHRRLNTASGSTSNNTDLTVSSSGFTVADGNGELNDGSRSYLYMAFA